MSIGRPLVSTFNTDKGDEIIEGKNSKSVLPAVFTAPIRSDIV